MREMRAGVSGTLRGATPAQSYALWRLFQSPAIGQLVHGGARGVDTEADALFREVNKDRPLIIIHPAEGHPWEGPEPTWCDIERPPLVRNKLIVQTADLMLIVPRTYTELRRSGTWTTYRYALEFGNLTLVILPDGRIEPAPLEKGRQNADSTRGR